MSSLLNTGVKGVSFKEMMNRMTFAEFLFAFGTLWLEGPDGEVKYRQWDPWKGIAGKPGQDDVAWMLPLVQVFYAPKARQKGLTELVSLYIAYIAMKEAKTSHKAFGASASQTKEIMELRFARKIEGMIEVYPEIPWLKWEIGKDRAECDNGSFFQTYSSENSGAHGGSPRFTLLDEAQNYAKDDYREMMKGILPVLRGRNQLAILGTSRSGSDFNDAVKGIRQRNPISRKDVWLSEMRTSDDRYHKTGMLFLADDLDPEHRVTGWREHTLIERYDGDVVDFKSMHPETIDDMFLSKAGKVVASWDDSRHVCEVPVVWKAHHEFYLLYDHGSTEGHPAVALFIQYDPYLDFVYVFDEVFERGKELAFVSAKIKKKLADWRGQWDNGGPRVHAYGDVRGRYGFRQVDDIMREETGISFLGVNKQDEAARIELVKMRHFRGQGKEGVKTGGISTWAAERKGGIAYSPRCNGEDGKGGSIKQISELRYKKDKDTPQELENDAFDDLGYGLYEISKREPTPEPTYEEKHRDKLAQWKRSTGGARVEETGTLDPLVECLKAG